MAALNRGIWIHLLFLLPSEIKFQFKFIKLIKMKRFISLSMKDVLPSKCGMRYKYIQDE